VDLECRGFEGWLAWGKGVRRWWTLLLAVCLHGASSHVKTGDLVVAYLFFIMVFAECKALGKKTLL
jgi:hypothetical protein